jgi:hypothetical protein
MDVRLNDYNIEKECVYKGERYSVRDNGAVLRHAHDGKSVRKYDNQWTFGKPNDKTGYMEIASVRVHRIVAIAFHGEPPTPQHIVDHIDTNRRNNRPENLRWLTKLENALNNPITRKRIISVCGSIEAFLADPSKLRETDVDPDFRWMRTVTSEEEQISKERLLEWAKNDEQPSGGAIGEWIYQRDMKTIETAEQIDSLTQLTVQKDWRTPCKFPCCPPGINANPIETYANNLKKGEIFSRNIYGQARILDFAMSDDKNTLWVMCKFDEQDSIKPWTLSQITFENGKYVHANLGSFFKKDGAEKQFTLLQRLEWRGGMTHDEYC